MELLRQEYDLDPLHVGVPSLDDFVVTTQEVVGTRTVSGTSDGSLPRTPLVFFRVVGVHLSQLLTRGKDEKGKGVGG